MSGGVEIKGISKVVRNIDGIRERLIRPESALRVISEMGRSDVIEHFEAEQGSARKWPGLSSATEAARRTGPNKKSGNKPLQDTGRLRGSIKVKTSSDEAVVYTNVKYGKYHEYGTSKMPQRDFMWLSDKALNKIVLFWNKFVMGR